MAWYIIHGMSKAKFYREVAYAKEGCRFRNHENMSLEKPREATQQACATLATIIVPLASVMPHKICT
jgi:hypothetical protein